MRLIQFTPEEFTQLVNEILDKKLDKILKHLKPETTIEYLSRKETSEILGVSLSTLNNWRNSEILEPVYIGKRVLYTRQAIDKKLAS
jgi:hypothetical protein